MYEQCCRKIQDLEQEKNVLLEELESAKHKSLKISTNQRQFDTYQKEAIIVEQNGQISSPLSMKNRN